MNIELINEQLKDASPEEIVAWALKHANKPVITTNFRPYEGAILNVVTEQSPSIDVLWCDTGYNTTQTYKHATELIDILGLNIDLFVPKQTTAYRDHVIGVPSVDDPLHEVFTQQVKLEPFQRAMAKHKPDVWFTNLRKGQTAFRDSIGIVSRSQDGVIKVSPFYNFSDAELDAYLISKNLPNEFRYFDPTKVEATRECGLHK